MYTYTKKNTCITSHFPLHGRSFDSIPQVLSILGGEGGFFGVHQQHLHFHTLDTSELATPFGVGELLPHVGDLYFPFPRWIVRLCRKCVCLGPGDARHFRAKTRKRATKRENAKTRTEVRKRETGQL